MRWIQAEITVYFWVIKALSTAMGEGTCEA
jgi:uncharacterized membrane-anchored protein